MAPAEKLLQDSPLSPLVGEDGNPQGSWVRGMKMLFCCNGSQQIGSNWSAPGYT